MPVNLKPLECRSNRPHQFSTANGIFVTKIEPGRAEGFLQVTRDSLNPHGKVHGGALAALADTVGGNCACARGRSCVTASQSMEFLRPAEGPYITCVATPKKEGHTLSVIQVELSNAEGEGGAHPVGDPGGAVQRGGKTGGHGDLHLFYDGPVVRGEMRDRR